MNREVPVLQQVQRYKKLQWIFKKFCDEARSKYFSPGNRFGIEFKEGDDLVCGMVILGHQCEARLGVRDDARGMIGRITFERVLPKDRAETLWTVFFDDLENATEEHPDQQKCFGTIVGPDIAQWTAIRLLEELFKQLIEGRYKWPRLRRVFRSKNLRSGLRMNCASSRAAKECTVPGVYRL